MSRQRQFALVSVGVLIVFIVLAFSLVLYRGGVIAWLALVWGVLLLIKVLWWPGRSDVPNAAALVFMFGASWIGTWYFVIQTYESAEVVELSFKTANRSRTARLWVMDVDAETYVYFDADPEAAAALMSGTQVQFSRGPKVSRRIPQAVAEDDVNQAQADLILGAMEAKYAERMLAVDLYYGLLGRPRNRVGLLIRLIEPDSG